MTGPKSRRARAGATRLPRYFLLLYLLALPVAALGEPGMRLVVDTEARELLILNDDRVRLRLRDVALGRFGAAADKRRGDGVTPIGRYRITGLRPHDKFHFFIDIDYPSVDDARRGYASGLISLAEKRAIERAHRRGEVPPQHTALGGLLGIHGVGVGDPEIHRQYNWTQGCVALDDWQIDELRPWLRVGMPVEIR